MTNICDIPDEVLDMINNYSECILTNTKSNNLCKCNKYFNNQSTSRCQISLSKINNNIILVCKKHSRNKLSLNLICIQIYIFLNCLIIIDLSLKIVLFLIILEEKNFVKLIIKIYKNYL